MKEHNTNFYSLENIKETLESCKNFLDGEEVYYHIGALRYAYEEIERLNNIIDELETYCNMVISMNFNMNNDVLSNQKVEDYTKILDKLKELKGSDKDGIMD